MILFRNDKCPIVVDSILLYKCIYGKSILICYIFISLNKIFVNNLKNVYSENASETIEQFKFTHFQTYL